MSDFSGTEPIRTSLENFGQFYYYDKEAEEAERQVEIIPLYALCNLQNIQQPDTAQAAQNLRS